MAGPLDGVLVVAIEQAVAAPLATARMCEAGARVIKIERPEGDFARDYDRACGDVSSYFAWLNRGKESLVLDLKAVDDMALLRRILAGADVLVQNLAPGALGRLGLGPAVLAETYPKLISVDISAYGPDGPYADRKGYDLLIQAESGLASVTGSPDAPGRVGVSVCDIATGLNAYSAVLEALIARGRTGRGGHLSISLFESAAEWMAAPLLTYEASGVAPRRIGLAHPSIAPYGVFDCADGEPVLIAVQNEREWAALCAGVLRQPELAADERFVTNVLRVTNRETLDEIIATHFSAQRSSDLISRLDAAAIAYGRVAGMADLARHPHLRRETALVSGRRFELPVSPLPRVGRAPPSVPAIGEHDERLRAEFAEG